MSKYGDICADTVARIYARERRNHPSEKEADKAAKTALHRITGAYMTEREEKRARECLQNRDLNGALKTHASTRERLAHLDEFYEALFRRAGEGLVVDVACGLNPLYLGARGVPVRGFEIHGGLVSLVNDWARAEGWDARAECADALCYPAYPQAETALFMKLLPLLEQQEKGAALRVFLSVPAKMRLATFPTRTLGGRRVGMADYYGKWFRENLPASCRIADEYVIGDELCFLVAAEE